MPAYDYATAAGYVAGGGDGAQHPPFGATDLDHLRQAVYDLKNAVVNVKDFGAIGDEVADDTVALQAAIDRAVAIGGICYLPAGTTPPAITDDGTSDDWRGIIRFGTGSGPAAGVMTDVRFNKNRGVALYPTITPLNAATAALDLYVSTITSAGFVVSALNAPAASQPGTTYQYAYRIER